MRTTFWLTLSACLLLVSSGNPALAQTTATRGAVAQVTVPLRVEGNRPFVDITFYRSDGSTRVARFFVDTGGGGFLITEPLARDLGLRWGANTHENGKEFGHVIEPPKASVGNFALELNPERVLVLVGADNALPTVAPGHADGLLPGHVLAQYLVVFDYPKGEFTLARANALKPKGTPLPMPVGRTGFPRTEIEDRGRESG